MKPRVVLLLGAALATAGVAGCSSSSGSGGSSTGGSGDTIKVGIFATTSAGSANAFVEPWSVDGLKAAAQGVNAAGGVKGRNIEIVVCDNAGDPNKDAACARKAVTDGWVAVAGGFDPYAATQTLPLLNAAQIPYVGFLQVSPIEYQSPGTFPIEAGVIGGASGTAAQMVNDGCKTPTYIGSNDSGGKSTADQVGVIFKKASLTYDGVVEFPPGTADVTPIVAAALAKNPDCMMFNGAGTDAAKIFAAAAKAGSKAKYYAAAAVLSPDAIAALGATANGIRGASTAPLSNNPSGEMKTLVADMQKYDPKAVINEFSINAYAALHVVSDGLTKASEISGPALLTTLNATTDANAGVFGKINFTKVRDSQAYPRLFNTSVWYSEIKNNTWAGADTGASSSDIGQYLP